MSGSVSLPHSSPLGPIGSFSFSSNLPIEPPSTLAVTLKQGNLPSLTDLANSFLDIEVSGASPSKEEINMLCQGKHCSQTTYLLFALSPYSLFNQINHES